MSPKPDVIPGLSRDPPRGCCDAGKCALAKPQTPARGRGDSAAKMDLENELRQFGRLAPARLSRGTELKFPE